LDVELVRCNLLQHSGTSVFKEDNGLRLSIYWELESQLTNIFQRGRYTTSQ
jgi:hypothetical protein